MAFSTYMHVKFDSPWKIEKDVHKLTNKFVRKLNITTWLHIALTQTIIITVYYRLTQ